MKYRIVVLTGAGISAESGLATFRGHDGLWENHRITDVATPEAFVRDPALVQRFYNERRRALLHPSIRPNAAHSALAKLEESLDGEFLLVTQNIDNLHERAGSRSVLHMHGRLLEVRCAGSGKVFPWSDEVLPDSRCNCCGSSGTLRPNIVWFGEIPFEMDRIYAALAKCTHFISIGTSGNVYPAAGFVEHVRSCTDAHTAELNLERSVVNQLFRERRYGPATEVVPAYVTELLAALQA
jgi:NAD-dependent deacetylase